MDVKGDTRAQAGSHRHQGAVNIAGRRQREQVYRPVSMTRPGAGPDIDAREPTAWPRSCTAATVSMTRRTPATSTTSPPPEARTATRTAAAGRSSTRPPAPMTAWSASTTPCCCGTPTRDAAASWRPTATAPSAVPASKWTPTPTSTALRTSPSGRSSAPDPLPGAPCAGPVALHTDRGCTRSSPSRGHEAQPAALIGTSKGGW